MSARSKPWGKPIAMYCLCGATARGMISPKGKADVVIEFWKMLHSGEGHGMTTPETAAQARRTDEARSYKMLQEEARA